MIGRRKPGHRRVDQAALDLPLEPFAAELPIASMVFAPVAGNILRRRLQRVMGRRVAEIDEKWLSGPGRAPDALNRAVRKGVRGVIPSGKFRHQAGIVRKLPVLAVQKRGVGIGRVEIIRGAIEQPVKIIKPAVDRP